MRRTAILLALVGGLMGLALPAQAQDERCVGGYVVICLEPSLNVLPILPDATIAIDRVCLLPGSCAG